MSAPPLTHSASSQQSTSSVSSILLTVLAALSAIAPLATDMYLPAFTGMASDLNTTASAIQLTLTTFLFGLAAGQLVIGPLSDRFGRRTPLLVGMVICTLASIGCVLSSSIEMLIALRFVQGFAGSAGIVISRSIISDRSTGTAAARAYSLLTAIGGVAPVVAPLLGGVLVMTMDWRGVLAVLAGVCLVLTVGAFMVVKESLPANERQRGGLRASFSMARGVLADRVYVGYTLCFAFVFGCLMAYISASPFVLQNVVGLGTLEYSAAFAVNALGIVLASIANVRLIARFDPRRLLAVACGGILLTGLVLAGVVAAGWTSLAVIGTVTFVLVAFVGIGLGNAATLAVARTRHAAGMGAAILGCLQFVVGAVASPLVGLGGEHTAVPLAIVVLACGLLGIFSLVLTKDRTVKES